MESSTGVEAECKRVKQAPPDETAVHQSRDSICDIWGPRTPYHGEGTWPARADHHVECDGQPDAWIQSACVLCSNGCGLDIAVKDKKIVGVRGRPDDPVNRGTRCPVQ